MTHCFKCVYTYYCGSVHAGGCDKISDMQKRGHFRACSL